MFVLILLFQKTFIGLPLRHIAPLKMQVCFYLSLNKCLFVLKSPSMSDFLANLFAYIIKKQYLCSRKRQKLVNHKTKKR